MLFSSSLPWSNHITYISSKTHKFLGLLYYTIISTAIQTLLLFFASTLLSSVLILNIYILLCDPQSSNLSSCLEKIQFNSLLVNYVVIIGPQTTLLFLSFIFLRYLLTTAMLNLSFSSSFFICQPTPCYNHQSFQPCNCLQIPYGTNLHSSHFSQPSQDYRTLFPTI